MALTDLVAFGTLENLKADLGIADAVTTYDSQLERRILSASSMIENYCRRNFRQATRTQTMPGYGTTRLLPSATPIAEVSSILMTDGSTVDPDLYSVEEDPNGEGWAIYCESGWQWTAPALQGSTASPIPLVGMERPAFVVEYVGGYGLPNDTVEVEPALPHAISEACYLLAAHLWRQKGIDQNVVGESVGDASVQRGYIGGVDASPAALQGIPGSIAAMLDAYRRIA